MHLDMTMKLPEITALQFAALSLLMAGEKTGRQLRGELSQWDGPASSAGFSQLMGRMRQATYVSIDRKGRSGQRFSECRYRVTDLGVMVWQAARQFYASFDEPAPDLEPVTTIEARFVDHPPSQRKKLVKQLFADTMLDACRRHLGPGVRL